MSPSATFFKKYIQVFFRIQVPYFINKVQILKTNPDKNLNGELLIPSVKSLVAPFCCSGTFKVEGIASNEHKVDLNQQTWLKQQRYLVGHQGRGTDVDAV